MIQHKTLHTFHPRAFQSFYPFLYRRGATESLNRSNFPSKKCRKFNRPIKVDVAIFGFLSFLAFGFPMGSQASM